jgi:hypothetical protein
MAGIYDVFHHLILDLPPSSGGKEKKKLFNKVPCYRIAL